VWVSAFIVQRLLLNFYLSMTIPYLLYFTRRISIVTAVRFVIVDFKDTNE